MTVAQQPSVTFLALAYPPNASDREGHFVQSLATALGHQGWQVNWVTTGATPDPQVASRLAPTCQLLSLPPDKGTGEPFSARSLRQTAQAILAQQSQRGLISPLFHSFDDTSALIGQYFKENYGWRWLHTPVPGSAVTGAVSPWMHTGPEPDQWLLWQDMATGGPDGGADEVSRQRQRHYGLANPVRSSWQTIATHLSNIYRQHLAAYVGASNLEIPAVLTLPALPERLTRPAQKREPILANA